MGKSEFVKLFEETLSDLPCQHDTKAYIVSIYIKYLTARHDLSKDSVTLLFAQARDNHDFLIYQNLGDWLFYTKSMFPQSFKNASEEYYDSIAKLSYYNCYRIVKNWKLYEQLADDFVILTKNARDSLLKSNIPILMDKNICHDD